MKGLATKYNSMMELHEEKMFCEVQCGDSCGTDSLVTVFKSLGSRKSVKSEHGKYSWPQLLKAQPSVINGLYK